MAKRVLAMLETEDQTIMLQGLQAISLAERQVSLMRSGQVARWAAIREKYGLPNTFEWDTNSGACWEEIVINGAVKADG